MICHGNELTTLRPSLLFCTFTPQVLGSSAHTPTKSRISLLCFFTIFFELLLFLLGPSSSLLDLREQGVKDQDKEIFGFTLCLLPKPT
jgi:hypothetical protein